MGAFNIQSIGRFLLAIAMSLALYLMPIGRQSNLIATERQSDEIRCLALTVYWEARAQGRAAMEAVGWVVLNRMKNPNFPDTACEVVRQGGEKSPCQFSYWCDGQSDTPHNADAWKEAREVAAQLLKNPPIDPTGGALFFHSVELTPAWAKEHRRTVEIGKHVFYR